MSVDIYFNQTIYHRLPRRAQRRLGWILNGPVEVNIQSKHANFEPHTTYELNNHIVLKK